ncbi:unnamed protein product [Dovyalis caffra]|uniref:Uncharacterized protein n=1 Tax=Dovyalis caffra TaxID=77055 RepID=A0AAV1SCV4_9ROSI|nr:unnamed protein product [Dovyalis caffra]
MDEAGSRETETAKILKHDRLTFSAAIYENYLHHFEVVKHTKSSTLIRGTQIGALYRVLVVTERLANSIHLTYIENCPKTVMLPLLATLTSMVVVLEDSIVWYFKLHFKLD